MAIVRVVNSNYGFRDRYNAEGALIKDVTEQEIIDMSKKAQIKHFEPFCKDAELYFSKVNSIDITNSNDSNIEDLRVLYFEKTGNEVPVNKKNNIEWIKKELDKE